MHNFGDGGDTRAGPSSDKYSWFRRLSTIAPSQDGSLGSTATPRPSTPSLFSNGSNAPLFPDSLPVTPRNKLVKRSTSQKVLHSGSFGGSPFSTPTQISTFRRPATSHQRSEHFRIQSLQRDLAVTNRLLETSHEQDRILEHPIQALQDSGASTNTWRPFFQSRAVIISRDTLLKSGTGSKLSGSADHIRCVVRSGTVPTLVIAPSVRRPTVNELSSTYTHKTPRLSSTEPGPPSSASAQGETRPDQDHKPRNSFSIADFLPSPSPSTWKKGRGGNLKKLKGSQKTSAMGRRAVSTPLQSSSTTKGFPEGSSPKNNRQHGTMSRNSSSPLPPLNRLSTFNIELSGDDPSSPISHGPNQPSSPFSQASPYSSSPLNIAGLTSGRVRSNPRRESHVPSDRDSTAFGSENEHSRVFSTDGEDTDGRSETVYDSIRTGGTGSSHSGARGQRAENLFDDTIPPDLAKHNLSALQGQLSGVVLSRPSDLDSFIAEEEESVRTPVRPAHSFEDGSLAPSQDHSQTFSAEPHSSPPSATRIPESRGASGDDTFDEVWSVEDNELWSTQAVDTHSRNEVQRQFQLSSRVEDPTPSDSVKRSERPKSNIFEWSERQPVEKDSHDGSSPRPRTAHAQQLLERGGRSSGRRVTNGQHLRSQSVPLPPENPKQRFNNTSKLDAWMLGGKGVSEEWDNDFEFDEPSTTTGNETNGESVKELLTEPKGVVVPRSIMERQATVHGQFGQVKELTLLVEELRRLRYSAQTYGILNGQASELWKEAEGIIDLASLEDDGPNYFSPHSPNSTSFDFDSFEEESPSLPRRKRSTITPPRADTQQGQATSVSSLSASYSSPAESSRVGTPNHRNRSESVAKAKHVLENIHQHRSTPESSLATSSAVPKKLPFDTTSLRDLVTRAGVVTRALKEIIRRVEDPDFIANTPEKRPSTPPDPPFSHIFHQPSSPSSIRKSPRMPIRKRSGSFISGSMTTNDNELNAHAKVMTVV